MAARVSISQPFVLLIVNNLRFMLSFKHLLFDAILYNLVVQNCLCFQLFFLTAVNLVMLWVLVIGHHLLRNLPALALFERYCRLPLTGA